MPSKTIVLVGDLHCGHKAGLTPAGMAIPDDLRDEMWQWYIEQAQAIGPPHLLIANGDLIDGKGGRNGGRELVETDMLEQAHMASECLKVWGASNYALVYGTPYHTGDESNFEDVVASDLGADKPRNHLFIEVNGLVFDIKHKVGGSGIPHGRTTAINKASLWNMVWAEYDMQPRADVFCRSHVHYHVFSGDSRRLMMTLPALQAARTEFGARQCEGYVDFGFVVFNVKENGTYTWKAITRRLVGVKESAQKY